MNVRRHSAAIAAAPNTAEAWADLTTLSTSPSLVDHPRALDCADDGIVDVGLIDLPDDQQTFAQPE